MSSPYASVCPWLAERTASNTRACTPALLSLANPRLALMATKEITGISFPIYESAISRGLQIGHQRGCIVAVGLDDEVNAGEREPPRRRRCARVAFFIERPLRVARQERRRQRAAQRHGEAPRARLQSCLTSL